MSKFGILSATTALAVSLALASPGFAQGRGGHAAMAAGGGIGGGGGHVSMGGGGGFGGHMGGGPSFGGHVGGAGFAARPGGGYAAMGPSRFSPGAATVAAGPHVGTYAGRTAWNGGYGWRGGRWHHRRGWWPGAAFVAGAALGSYAYYGGPYYDDYYDYGPDYYYDTGVAVGVPVGGDAVAYCESRFRSYDPASGTYLGYDGLRHPCP